MDGARAWFMRYRKMVLTAIVLGLAGALVIGGVIEQTKQWPPQDTRVYNASQEILSKISAPAISREEFQRNLELLSENARKNIKDLELASRLYEEMGTLLVGKAIEEKNIPFLKSGIIFFQDALRKDSLNDGARIKLELALSLFANATGETYDEVLDSEEQANQEKGADPFSGPSGKRP